jgi:hypothetical protein
VNGEWSMVNGAFAGQMLFYGRGMFLLFNFQCSIFKCVLAERYADNGLQPEACGLQPTKPSSG